MRTLFALVFLAGCVAAQDNATARLSTDDVVRIREFYRLASAIQDQVWPGWSAVPAPLLLVTPEAEFLTHHPAPPSALNKVGEDLYYRPRQFPTNFQATFPAFGLPPVIVIGEPANTLSQTSTPWLFTLMHEHFHQLQWAQPGYMKSVEGLDLSRGDTSGMWMLNYPFPYDKPEVEKSFRELRDTLLRALAESDRDRFEKLAAEYAQQRRRFFAQLSADDHKYLSFQLWQEGIARYTEVKAAEAAANYKPAAEFAKLADFESFASYAENARRRTLGELQRADLPTWKWEVVYSFGAAEGFLLDRIDPKWKDEYFKHVLSVDSYFGTAKK
jgi:hypothetical protein